MEITALELDEPRSTDVRVELLATSVYRTGAVVRDLHRPGPGGGSDPTGG